MMTRTCPSCGAESATGRFCSNCGAPLEQSVCAACGSSLLPGAKFCNQCGASVGASAPAGPVEPRSSGRSWVPWTIAAVAAAALAVVLLVPRSQPAGEQPDARAAAGPFGDPSAVDISSMTPAERAGALFNRVMQSVAGGDTAQAQAFLPMALDAHALVPEPSLDVRYHFAVLHLIDGNPAAARAQADSILQAEQSHLLGLFTAAQAEQALGNRAAASSLYRRFLDSYDAEIGRGLPEYQDHARALPANRAEAERQVAGP